jgi:hypothetical protein
MEADLLIPLFLNVRFQIPDSLPLIGKRGLPSQWKICDWPGV